MASADGSAIDRGTRSQGFWVAMKRALRNLLAGRIKPQSDEHVNGSERELYGMQGLEEADLSKALAKCRELLRLEAARVF